jgi:hypothetical protein
MLIVMQTSWLTPSEIFTPYYGRAVANFVLDKHAQLAASSSTTAEEPLRVFELGGGTGTLARDIMDHVRSAAPGVYDSMQYCCVEISPRLARLQQETIAGASSAGHSERFRVITLHPGMRLHTSCMRMGCARTGMEPSKDGMRVVCGTWPGSNGMRMALVNSGRLHDVQVECRDAADLAGWEAAGSCGEAPCVVLAMEVLDNCAHDQLRRAGPSQPWQQTAVLLPDR